MQTFSVTPKPRPNFYGPYARRAGLPIEAASPPKFIVRPKHSLMLDTTDTVNQYGQTLTRVKYLYSTKTVLGGYVADLGQIRDNAILGERCWLADTATIDGDTRLEGFCRVSGVVSLVDCWLCGVCLIQGQGGFRGLCGTDIQANCCHMEDLSLQLVPRESLLLGKTWIHDWRNTEIPEP